jgi:hypothetical protein
VRVPDAKTFSFFKEKIANEKGRKLLAQELPEH